MIEFTISSNLILLYILQYDKILIFYDLIRFSVY